MSSFIRNKSGFTLIELMVVITIISILFVWSYVPYDYYSRLSKVHVSVNKVQQTLENTKIFSQNGQLFPWTTKNANTWLLLKKWAHTMNIVTLLPGTRSFIENENTKIIKIVSLENGVNINTIPYDTILIEYTAPRWDMEIYISPTQTGANFDIGVGWKQVTSGTLYKTVKIEK